MSEKETTKPEVAKETAQEGGDMKISKPKFDKFKGEKDEPFKVDLSKVDTSLEANAKVEEPIKVDLSKKTETETKQEDDAIPIGETNELPEDKRTEDLSGVDAEVRSSENVEQVQEPESPIVEVSTEPERVVEKQIETPQPKQNLPENITNLVKFMEETGGTVEDYVRLNADYSNVNDDRLLREYYSKTKPHLDKEEVDFIIEENFTYDEEIDEERDVKRKKLAKKEAVAEAKNFLEDMKNKYYQEIKLRPGVTQEQQKAMEFFNRYNKEQEIATQKHKKFLDTTNEMFSNEFKGFDFEVGEKKYRYGVKDPSAVAENQSNLNNFVERFLDKEGNVKDTKGYHKAIYAAQNIDKIVNHFYEQGKSDGIKAVVEKSKNPTIDQARQSGTQDIYVGGFKVRAIDGVDSSRLKIKRSKFNN
tara:strand:- start:1130 stop:2383 length:1254 start_codon:yes stop_codon:yes gene_type:complete